MKVSNNQNGESSKDNMNASQVVVSYDTELGMLRSDVTTHVDVTVEDVGHTTSRYGDQYRNNGRYVLADYTINVPKSELMLWGEPLFVHMAYACDNYYRDHYRTWWRDNPDFVIVKDGEITTWLTANPGTTIDDFYHANSDTLVMRLVTRLWHANEAFKMMHGAECNLYAWSRVSGMSQFKSVELSKNFRWSIIKARTEKCYEWPAPKLSDGTKLDDYYERYCQICNGRTVSGAEVTAVPIVKAEIYGNNGTKVESIDDMFAPISGIAKSSATKPATINCGAQPGDVFKDFHYRMLMAQDQHGFTELTNGTINRERDEDSIKSNNPGMSPICPPIENGKQIILTAGGDDRYDRRQAWQEGGVKTTAVQIDTNIAGSLVGQTFCDNIVATFDCWLSYVNTYFNEFTEPASKWYKLMMGVDQFADFIPERYRWAFWPRNERMSKRICDNKRNGDIKTMLQTMKYKYSNRANTATVINFVPLCSTDTNMDPIGPYGYRNLFTPGTASYNDNIAFNYERVKFTRHGDYAEMIRTAKLWPGLTPRTFYADGDTNRASVNILDDESIAPWVFNTPVEGGLNASNESTSYRNLVSRRSVIGKCATYLDWACMMGVDPRNKVGFVGIPASDAKKFVEMADGVIFDDNPTQVWVDELPPVDTTDIYQCGFNVILQTAIGLRANEWQDYFTDPNAYVDTSLFVNNTNWRIDGEGVAGAQMPTCCGYKKVGGAGADWDLKHVGNEVYMNGRKFAHIFVGDQILSHPWDSITMLQAGTPFYELQSTDANSGGDMLTTLAQHIATSRSSAYITSSKMGNDDDVALKCVAQMLLEAAAGGDSRENVHGGSMAAYGGNACSLQHEIVGLFTNASDRLTWYETGFNPMYGKISIGAWKMPLSDFIPAYPTAKVIEEDLNYIDDFTSGSAKMGPAVIHDNKGSNSIQALIPATRFSNDFPDSSQWLLWFVDYCEFVQMTVDQRNVTRKRLFTGITHAGAQKWIFRDRLQGSINHPGFEDVIKYTYDRNPLASHSFEMGTGLKYTEETQALINAIEAQLMKPAPRNGLLGAHNTNPRGFGMKENSSARAESASDGTTKFDDSATREDEEKYSPNPLGRSNGGEDDGRKAENSKRPVDRK